MEKFDWDDANRTHLARHDISPEEAEQVFINGPSHLELQNQSDEDRFTLVGETDHGRILIVAATWRGDKLRVITAWDAPKAMKSSYLKDKGAMS